MVKNDRFTRLKGCIFPLYISIADTLTSCSVLVTWYSELFFKSKSNWKNCFIDAIRLDINLNILLFLFILFVIFRIFMVVCTYIFFYDDYNHFVISRKSRNKKYSFTKFLFLNMTIFDISFLLEMYNKPTTTTKIFKSIALLGLIVLIFVLTLGR